MDARLGVIVGRIELTSQTTPTATALSEPSLDGYQRLKPGPGKSRLEVAANQRARLQRAMIELTVRDGFAAVTVRKLTKLAAVSNETFYARFSGIDDCLLAAYGEVMSEAVRRVVASRVDHLDPGKQVERALRALLGYLVMDNVVARFSLIEIYGGGPAALATIRAQDARLESALRECLDRRSRCFPQGVAASITAASLHCARSRLIGALPDEAKEDIETLVEWARDVVDGRDEVKGPNDDFPRQLPVDAEWAQAVEGRGGCDEEDMILTAVLRLASSGGFFSLTPTRVSSAAGVPAARCRRHFASVADGFLAAVRRTCREFFIELTSAPPPDSFEQLSTRWAVQRAARRAVANPVAAHLTFGQIVEPGIPGVTCRDSLISELAAAWSAATPVARRPVPVRADARVAALWASLAAGPEQRYVT
jgi:AcrR family transcriptional regulator